MDDVDPVVTPLMVPLINRNETTIKRLENNKSLENIGLRVQLDSQCVSQLGEHREKMEEWARKVKNRPPSGKGIVAKLHTATVVQREVWTGGICSHTEGDRE